MQLPGKFLYLTTHVSTTSPSPYLKPTIPMSSLQSVHFGYDELQAPQIQLVELSLATNRGEGTKLTTLSLFSRTQDLEKQEIRKAVAHSSHTSFDYMLEVYFQGLYN